MQRIVNLGRLHARTDDKPLLNKKLEATDSDLEKQIEINRQKKEKENEERKKRNDDVARAYKLPRGKGTKKPPPGSGGGGNKRA